MTSKVKTGPKKLSVDEQLAQARATEKSAQKNLDQHEKNLRDNFSWNTKNKRWDGMGSDAANAKLQSLKQALNKATVARKNLEAKLQRTTPVPEQKQQDAEYKTFEETTMEAVRAFQNVGPLGEGVLNNVEVLDRIMIANYAHLQVEWNEAHTLPSDQCKEKINEIERRLRRSISSCDGPYKADHVVAVWKKQFAHMKRDLQRSQQIQKRMSGVSHRELQEEEEHRTDAQLKTHIVNSLGFMSDNLQKQLFERYHPFVLAMVVETLKQDGMLINFDAVNENAERLELPWAYWLYERRNSRCKKNTFLDQFQKKYYSTLAPACGVELSKLVDEETKDDVSGNIWKQLINVPGMSGHRLANLMATSGKLANKAKYKGTFGIFMLNAPESALCVPNSSHRCVKNDIYMCKDHYGTIARDIEGKLKRVDTFFNHRTHNKYEHKAMFDYLFEGSPRLLDICMLDDPLYEFPLEDLIIKAIEFGDKYKNVAGPEHSKIILAEIKEFWSRAFSFVNMVTDYLKPEPPVNPTPAERPKGYSGSDEDSEQEDQAFS
jgi:hypothetical protein